MSKAALIAFAVGLALVLTAAGCGGPSTTSTSQFTTPTPATVTSTTPPSPAYVSINPHSVALGGTQSQQFVATMSNGAATTFDWTITDCTGECGTITSQGVYSAPSFVSITKSATIRATSRADQNMVGIAYVSLQAVHVVVTPSATVRLAANAARPFNALIEYDPANSGVTWSLSGTGCTGNTCGTLTDATPTSAMYHSPTVPPTPRLVTLKAASITDTNQSAVAGVIVMDAAAQYKLQGKYAFLVQGKRWDTTDGGEIAMAGNMDIGADGTVTGFWDATYKASGGITEPLSGSYTAESDGVGTLTLQGGSGTWKFALAVQAGGDAAALAHDPADSNSTLVVQSGYLVRQDANAFAMASVQGDRVLALTFMNVGAIGRVTLDTAGKVSNGIMDLTWQGCCMKFFTTSTLTGSFTAPDPLTGRGTAALSATPGPDTATETFHFAYYIVSDKKMLLVQSDANTWQYPVLRGEARYQNGAGTFSNASLNASAIFSLSSDDAGMWWTPMVTLGQILPNASGSLNSTWDNNEVDNDDLPKITLAASESGSDSVAANGRVVITLPGRTTGNYTPQTAVAYLLDSNTGYFIREAVFGTPFGFFEPQMVATFSTATMAGSFGAYIAGPPRTFKPERDAGFVNLRNDGTAEVFFNLQRWAGDSFYWSGTFAVSENGRGVMNLTDSATGQQKTIVFWTVSPNRVFAIVSMTAGDGNPVLVEFRR